MLLKAQNINSCSKAHEVSLEVHARCMTLQEVPKIQISGTTAALVQESVEGDSLTETNEEMMLRANVTVLTITN